MVVNFALDFQMLREVGVVFGEALQKLLGECGEQFDIVLLVGLGDGA